MRVSENSKIRRICISGALFLFYASRFFQCGIIVLDLSAFYEFMCKNPAPKCGIFDCISFVNETWRSGRDSNPRGIAPKLISSAFNQNNFARLPKTSLEDNVSKKC